jgi:FtsP/CotA-like multicopper oxidase with cupredoxin domain
MREAPRPVSLVALVSSKIADHVIHIHTNPFQMVAINGRSLSRRDWRDTVVVPSNGSVTFRTRFLDFTGRFVHHCSA